MIFVILSLLVHMHRLHRRGAAIVGALFSACRLMFKLFDAQTRFLLLILLQTPIFAARECKLELDSRVYGDKLLPSQEDVQIQDMMQFCSSQR